MSTRSCTHVRADLSAYLDGDLDSSAADATSAHLAGCAACRSELALQRLALGALRGLPDLPPPAGILSGVRARLHPEPWYRRLPAGRRWLFGVPVGALATLLVVVGLSLFQARSPGLQEMTGRSPLPPAPPPLARRDLRAKGAFDAAAPRGAFRGGEAAAPEPSAVAGADKEVHHRAAPAFPVAANGPGATGNAAAVEPKAGASRPSEPRRQVVAKNEAFREESGSVENVAAAPSRGVAPRPEPPSERTTGRGAGQGSAMLAGEQATASKGFRIVCLLPASGDTVDAVTRLLVREGAGVIAVNELDPRAVRAAFAPYRGRRDLQTDPARGWTVTASLPPPAFARLLTSLASRAGLRLLEQPAAHAAPENPARPVGLHITVFR